MKIFFDDVTLLVTLCHNKIDFTRNTRDRRQPGK